MALESKDNARESVSAVEGSAQQPPALPDRYADESYKLFSKVQVLDPTPEEARRIRNKCLWRILPFICIGYHVMYVDKQTVCVVFFFFLSTSFSSITCLMNSLQLGSSAILGILEDAHLNSTQYNWLSSIFYFGYLLAEYPQNWALQRFPVAKWLAGNLVIWWVLE